MKRKCYVKACLGYFRLFTLLLTGALLLTNCKKQYFFCKACPAPVPPAKNDPTPPQPPVPHSSNPCANAGEEQVVFLPANSTQLDATLSYVSNGKPASYQWKQISGPGQSSIVNPTLGITAIQNLLLGTYQFELKITDSSGLFSADTATVIVANNPVADCSTNRITVPVHLIPYNFLSGNYDNLSAAKVGCPCNILFAGGFAEDSNSTWLNSNADLFDVTVNNHISAMLSQPRQGMAVATVGNKVFFAGGGDHDWGTTTTRVDIFDADNGQWSTAELGQPRSYLSAATVGHQVFFAGGGNWAQGYYTGTNWVDIYDDSAKTWSSTTLSEARYSLTATTSGHKIFFAGGRTAAPIAGGQVSATIDIYDADNNSWSVSHLYEPKADMASIAVGDKIFWAGGASNLDSGKASNIVEIRDANTGSSVISCLHVGKMFNNAALWRNTIVFFNGYTRESFGSDYLDEIDLYDLTTGKWSVGKLDQPVSSAGIVSAKNNIYIAGGTSNRGFPYYDQVWTLQW
jgi:N-acetylneuraminic acid mutarotase